MVPVTRINLLSGSKMGMGVLLSYHNVFVGRDDLGAPPIWYVSK